MTAYPSGVDLRSLIAAYPVGKIVAHHVPDTPQVVRDVVRVTDVDDIRAVGPDSVVLLGEELSLGGWIVSVALRYAWERHAVAIVVSEATFSHTVVELARRFRVALLSTSRRIDQAAITFARQLGALEAGVLQRLDALSSRIMAATTLDQIVQEISQELDGCSVRLSIADVTVIAAGARRPDAVEVRVPISGDDEQDFVAVVPNGQQEFARSALTRARACARVLILTQELEDISAASPLLSFAALLGMPHGRGYTPYLDTQSPQSWPSGAPGAAVVLSVANDDADTAERMGPVLSSRWRRAFPRLPLVRVQTGWFTFVPYADSADAAETTASEIAGVGMGDLGLAVGIAHDETGTTPPNQLLRRAWLAARLAEPADGIVDFSQMGIPLVQRLLRAADAQDLVTATFPRLLADPHARDVIESTVAYLDCAGSATTASALLGIHRNTIQSRLRRAAELGVPLDTPSQLLSTHLLLSALDLHSVTPSTLRAHDQNGTEL